MCNYLSNIPCTCEKKPVNLLSVFGDPTGGSDKGALERAWTSLVQGQWEDLATQFEDYLSACGTHPRAEEAEWTSHILTVLEQLNAAVEAAVCAVSLLGEPAGGVERRLTLREDNNGGMPYIDINDIPTVPFVREEQARHISVFSL